MENQEIVQRIRKRLEERLESHRELVNDILRTKRDSAELREQMDCVIYPTLHKMVVIGINEVYSTICEEFSVPYQEIKSRIDTL
jgi:hypothetical protein